MTCDQKPDHAMPLVSVIVPIYKVEPFIRKCVESVLAQTYSKLEIILVDDGSPDNCGKIIDEYKKNPQTVIVHKKNGGVSSARNAGLALASGEYIMFVDGDDSVDSDYVAYFIELLQKTGCAMGVGVNYYYAGKRLGRVHPDKVSDPLEIIESIYLGKLGVAVWNKIYRRDVLEKHSIRFREDIWYGEGMLYNIQFLQFVDKVAVGYKCVYDFGENNNSATRLFNLDSVLCGLRSMILQRECWIKANCQVAMAWEYHFRRYAEHILQGIIASHSEEQYSALYNSCVHSLKRNLRIPLQVSISSAEKTRAICMAIDPILVLTPTTHFSDCPSFSYMCRLFLIKLVRKIPRRVKNRLFRSIQKHYQNHYKPIYMDKALL